MRPVIGISCAWSQETWGAEATKSVYDYVARSYAFAIYRAGGIPVLIPPVAEEADLETCAQELLDRLDGVYFSGGGDVRRKSGSTLPGLYAQQPTRSRWEDVLLKAAYQRDFPVLGVCRGYQMMAVAFGGAMDPVRLPEHLQAVPYDRGIHDIIIAQDSLLAQIAETDSWCVNSIHVEHVKTVPQNFDAVAWTADGTIEAIAARDKAFFLGTQFHPELMGEDPRALAVLRSFVAAATPCKA